MSALALPIVSKFDPRGLNDAKTGLDRLGGFARSAGTLLAGAFVAGGIAAGAFAVSSLRAADESWKVGKALDQAAKNAGVFGNTDKDIQKATDALKTHAQTLGELIGVDDEVLLSMEKTFLAVPSLAGLGVKGIEHLTEVAANVAAGTGKDIESIGLAFVKVAGDSENAFSKLTRQGIVFTDAQKQAYEAILATGDEVAANAYLIDQLDTKYAGMAEAAASPLARIQFMFQNFQETVGTSLMPALEKLAPVLGDALSKMVADPEFQKFLEGMTQAFIDMIPQLMDALPSLLDLTEHVLPLLIELLPGTLELLDRLVPAFEWLAGVVGGLLDYWNALLSPVQFFNDLMKITNDVIKQGVDPARAFKDLIKDLPTPFQEVAKFAYNAGVGIHYVIDAVREFLGLPPLSVKSSAGAVSVRDYVGGGLKLASGGIIMPKPGGTMATIGEAGQAEAVIPLDKLGTVMGGGGGGTTYNVVVNGGLSTSADIGRAVVDAIKKYERVSGPVFVGA